ncbi:MAG: exosortase J [Terracidiphilus sp.]|jgi:exosortase J
MAENLELAPPSFAPGATKPELRAMPRSRFLPGCGVAALSAAGCIGIYRELAVLWVIWTTDPLRSIGMLIPPISIALTLRVWRQHGWQVCGTWWGLAVIALSYFLSLLRQKMLFFAVFGSASVSFIPISLPIYVYGCGIILLFAGAEVWRKAWFPLGLLLLSQPVPILVNGLIDLPLQSISARVARSFATLIHFAPTTPQLRLMFSPDFGMFIAPGCDGIRGAIAMGYVALILGYLKRFGWWLWATCVVAAFLLGYLFNFLRLCVLVVYYRVALGHLSLESIATQADYAIGSCLFLVATLLFVRLASRQQGRPALASVMPDARRPGGPRAVWIKSAAFATTVLAALGLPSSVLHSSRAGENRRQPLAARMPGQIGNFALTRTWYEQQSGTPVVRAGAYSAPGSDEIIVGVWIAPLTYFHDAGACWLARGLKPDLLTVRPYHVAGNETVNLSTGFYSDGITDSIVVNAACTPEKCSQFAGASSMNHFGIVFLDQRISALTGSDEHPVSIMVRIDRLHVGEPQSATQGVLSDEAQRFLAGFDPTGLSRVFQ